MANCNDQGCTCLVQGGTGVLVTGNGSARDPFTVALDGSLADILTVQDTESINLQLLGSGTLVDPYRLSAFATVRLNDLADVDDPQGGPNVGDVPVWVGSGATGHWEFQPPPTVPPGTVNTGAGIDGDGTIGAPISVSVVGTSAGGTTSGLEVYVDSAGNLRAVPPVGSSVTWASITGKPTTFPTTPSDFTGVLPVDKGGTGATALSSITVGNSTLLDSRRVYTQSSTPSGTIPLNSLWFW
jgi:hypothetical protein